MSNDLHGKDGKTKKTEIQSLHQNGLLIYSLIMYL